MMSLNVVILEDELASRATLSNLLEEHYPQINIIGSFYIPENAYQFLIQHHAKVDILFLDIQLPNQSGIEFMQHLPFIPQFEVILPPFFKNT